MTRLVVVTQQVNPDDPVLAATVPKLRALAAKVDSVTVMALGGFPEALPDNCTVRLFGAGSKAARGVRFERALVAELQRPRPIAVLAHMCPIYAVLAAPLARPLGVPVLLWFTHWRRSPTLRLAGRLSSTVLSVDRRSAPLDSHKVVGIGHGIDLAEFPCRPRPEPAEHLRLLALGRYSPAKGLPTVIEAVAAGTAELTVHGAATTAEERAHREGLEALVARLGVGDRVRLEGAVPRTEIPDLLARADALVNNMRAGAPDKVVYEAAAACVPVIASNPVFDAFLPADLRFAREDASALGETLAAFSQRGGAERAEAGRLLRQRVAGGHSVEHWADAVIEAAKAAKRR